MLQIWSGQDPSFRSDRLEYRRIVLSGLDDCGILHCGRVV